MPKFMSVFADAPHNFQLGWSQPVADLNGSMLIPGVWTTELLPRQTDTNINYIRIKTDWHQYV